MTSAPTPEEVEAVLARRAESSARPSDEDLRPVYDFLRTTFASTRNEGSSKSAQDAPHWFCSRSESRLHREAATYLIFLFAFSSERSRLYVKELEGVLSGCEKCARNFGSARRRFDTKYMSKFTVQVRTNFFTEVDKRQAEFISKAYGKASENPSTKGSGLAILPPPLIQLLFSESSLIKLPSIDKIVQSTVNLSPTSPLPSVTSLGLNILLVHLLSTPDLILRKWAEAQLPGCSRQPLSFESWCSTGTGKSVQDLYSGEIGLQGKELWTTLRTLLKETVFSEEVIEKGILDGRLQMKLEAPKGRSIMTIIASQLKSASDPFPEVLSCFAALLRYNPTLHMWSFDSSPELPHTLFSDIKTNPSFNKLLTAFQPLPGGTVNQLGRLDLNGTKEIDDPLGWLGSFLVSLLWLPNQDEIKGQEKALLKSPFGEALAKVASWCFAEMQHSSFEEGLKAKVAHAGLDACTILIARLNADDTVLLSSMSATLDVHAAYITSIALRRIDPPWEGAVSAAQNLLNKVLQSDSDSIARGVLELACISYGEKARQRKIRSKKPADPAVKVSHLHRASVRKEIWASIYTSLRPKDMAGLAVLLNSVASQGQFELIDRHRSWKHEGLSEVIEIDEWTEGVRAINRAVQTSRQGFKEAIEASLMRLDHDSINELWQIPGVSKSVTMLLLSPDKRVHEPIISLIQQSYDVDERADCFRILLEKYPHQALRGLSDFLDGFVALAKNSPESCSLAKWLVRCFTDILDVLCSSSSTSDEPLLQSSSFLSTAGPGKSISRMLKQLWQSMSTSLAVIFNRTQYWAPLFDNETMVDWMRDALIFGRHLTENTRMFESAVFANPVSDGSQVTPRKKSSNGRAIVEMLYVVLIDLTAWLRLTDVETLHQTFSLVKDILLRISKSKADLTSSPQLQQALQELDKFSRQADKSHRSRLSPDLLSELADLLSNFDLGLDEEDEIQYLKTGSVEQKSSPPKATTSTEQKGKNAFEILMQKEKDTKDGNKALSNSDKKSHKVEKPPKDIINVDDEFDDFDDNILDGLSARDLQIIENRAKTAKAAGIPIAGSVASRPSIASRPATSAPRPQANGPKIQVNVVPPKSNAIYHSSKPPAPSSKFKTGLMKDLHREHRADVAKLNKPPIGGFTRTLPTASSAGSGIGAYQPTSKPKLQVMDSGSSASESSDDEKGGLTQLIKKQRSPLKPLRSVHVPRQIRVIGEDMAEIYNQREKERQKQYRMKMRLKPDLNPLFRYILAWNPQHPGPDAPHPEMVKKQLGSCTPITASIPTVDRYEKTLLPLYLQELWAQCQKEGQGSNNNMPIAVEVTSKAYEDDFLDLELALAGQVPEKLSLNDLEIVTLSHVGSGHKIFAKVQNVKKRFKDMTIKVRILQNMDHQQLSTKQKWLLQKHLSLSTAVREFAALRGLPFYEPDLLQDILAGRSATLPRFSNYQIDDAMKTYSVNEPQAKAILGSINAMGFALIQGPPGTGKTKTISGLVGKWMSERPNNIAAPGEKVKKAKLLVCAPSNAAIDEVCKRLMNGVPSSNGIITHPNIVRIGIDASVNDAVKDRSLDNLVEARVSSEPNAAGGGGEYTRIQGELEEVKQKIRVKQEELRNLSHNDDARRTIEKDHHALVARRTHLGQEASKAKDAARDATRHLEGARRAAKEAILEEADIVCATLSGAGQEILAAHEFETVIIDEAAQAIEMSCLIPLKYGCKRCIMVGDPNQLPPTTFSTDAERFHYNQSLFVRMARAHPTNLHLLSIQYRMHPYISELPSKVFYNGQLKDGPDMATKTKAIWHSKHVFGPYRFFDIDGVERKQGTSTKNEDEARAAVQLYRNLEQDFGSQVNLAMRIGVITMYKEQLWELRRQFKTAFGDQIVGNIEFNTVDGFQGQEKDIIILSCVRSGPNLNTIGFLRDSRRMNVALTRAKSSLFVIGNAATLERGDEKWRIIVQDARDRGFVIPYNASTFVNTEKPPTPIKRKVKKEKNESPVKLNNGEPSADVLATATPLKRKSSVGDSGHGKKSKLDAVNGSSAPKAVHEPSSPSFEKRKTVTDGVAFQSNRQRKVSDAKKQPLPSEQSKTFSQIPGVASNSSNSHSDTPPLAPAIKQPPPPRPAAPPAPVNPAELAFRKKKPKPKPSMTAPVTTNGFTVRQQLNQQHPVRRL